jgi:DNA-binding NarL/FixJ family response regulator
MSLMGHSVNEIADDVAYSERNVIRIRTHFRKRLEAENRPDAL